MKQKDYLFFVCYILLVQPLINGELLVSSEKKSLKKYRHKSLLGEEIESVSDEVKTGSTEST